MYLPETVFGLFLLQSWILVSAVQVLSQTQSTTIEEQLNSVLTRKEYAQQQLLSMKNQLASMNNTLKNVYTNTESVEKMVEGSVMVFVHHDDAIMGCIEDITNKKALYSSDAMTVENRHLWSTSSQNNNHKYSNMNKNSYTMHHGEFSFGMCEHGVDNPCSYFLMLEDPLEHATKMHKYCKTHPSSDPCHMFKVNDVSLYEWILDHNGSILQQFLFDPQLCRVSKNGSDQTANTPCWIKQKQKVHTLSEEHLKSLTDFILDNLENWFAVIGIKEYISDSLKMFEHASKLPFTRCKHFRDVEYDSLGVLDNKVNHNKHYVTEDNNHDFYNDPQYVQYDDQIVKALQWDRKIYKRAVQIFQLQKQKLFNKIGR